jgi:hypothetical protein
MRRVLALVALLALAFALFLALRGGETRSAGTVADPGSAPQADGARAPEPAAVSTPIQDRVAGPGPALDGAASVPTDAPGAAGARPGTTWSLQGQVLERETLAPCAGARVALVHAGRSSSATCDAAGQFALDLPEDRFPRGASASASVFAGERREVFRGPIVLEAPLVLLARRSLVLRGALVSDVEPADRMGVSASLPPSGSREVELFAGASQLDASGGFEIQAVVDATPDAFLLVFGARGGPFGCAEVPTAELLSEAGATVVLSARALVVTVADESTAAPVAGAALRLRSRALPPPIVWSDATSDAQGRAAFLLPPGELELVVGKPGYAFAYQRRAFAAGEAGEETLVSLRRLGEAERLSGFVRSARGEPVSGAFVTLSPSTDDPDIGVAAAEQAHTDPEGRFSIPIDVQQELEVVAYHADHGLTPPLVVRPWLEREPIQVVFEELGELVVHPIGLSASSGASSGPFEWLLLTRSGSRVVQGHEWQCPLPIGDLPLGLARLYLRHETRGLWGWADVDVRAGELSTVEIGLVPAHALSGRILSASGAPLPALLIQPEIDGLPTEVRDAWCTDRTSADGSFHAWCGSARRARAGVLGPDRADSVTIEIESGSARTFEVEL